jgi:riboflavin kinase/FMN adenylyltransferase
LVAEAKRVGGPAVIFTFDPHPLAILKPEWLPTPMTRIERKADLLDELGINALIAYPTDRRLLSLEPAEFFRQVVLDRLAARAMVEGPNFHFGKDRAGDVAVLRELCEGARISLDVVEPVAADGEIVSSSRVRKMIQDGDIRAANELLTQPYRLSGIVGRGAARGRQIGFPTANLEQIATVLPALGVYAGQVWVEAKPFAAAVNIGPNPTFGESAIKAEVHLIDFADNLYDQSLSVDLLDRLRGIQPFSNVDALVTQLRQDVEHARMINDPKSEISNLKSSPFTLPS